jgi:hypothetical protein
LAEPLRFFSRSAIRTAPELTLFGNAIRPYSQWLYMDHGYFFFAPNPGPGHLVQYQVGSETRTFPDKAKHWPRLLYHRHFMLSEFYTSRYAPRQVTDDLKQDPEFMDRWTFDLDIYSQMQSSILKSLTHSTGSNVTELQRLERTTPGPDAVLAEGIAIDDARWIEVLPESMLQSAELPAKPTAETVPSPTPTSIRSSTRDSRP